MHVSDAAHGPLRLRGHDRPVDIMRQLQSPVYDLGGCRAGAATTERELAATDGILGVHGNQAIKVANLDCAPSEVDPGASPAPSSAPATDSTDRSNHEPFMLAGLDSSRIGRAMTNRRDSVPIAGPTRASSRR